MKKFILIVTIIFLTLIGYIIYVEVNKNKIPPLVVETEQVEINKYYIYGTSLNMEGTLKLENTDFEKIELVLYNKDIKIGKKETIDKRFTVFSINYTKEENIIKFNLSDFINDGMYLDNIPKGNQNMFIRTTHKELIDEEEITTYKYYSLNNNTEYSDTTYYTMSKYNNKILINSNNYYNTMMLNVEKNNDKLDVYDIVIDAGHGGKDPGAIANGYKEIDFTLDLAIKLKSSLENLGLKVKLTRDENTLGANDYFGEYGVGGRAQISHEVYAKYLLSLHINSSSSSKVNGLEIYTPSNIDYDFVKKLAENITTSTGVNYSNQKTFKMFNGVYTHNFTESEISSSAASAIDKGRTPYDITTNSNYLYIIRETGGIMTGAYVDDRNEEQTGNDYYKSNIGTESYLLELCYLTNLSDLEILKTKQENYIEAISNTIKDNLIK